MAGGPGQGPTRRRAKWEVSRMVRPAPYRGCSSSDHGGEEPDQRPLLLGVPCHTNGLRLFTFKTKGCDCVLCGLKGSWFAIEPEPHQTASDQNRDAEIPADIGDPYHLNLYAVKDGVEIHDDPRSHPGKSLEERITVSLTVNRRAKSVMGPSPRGN